MQLPHQVAPGKLGRGVGIKRKQREYEANDITRVLNELGINPVELIPAEELIEVLEEDDIFGLYGTGGYLPLEIFDNEDFDCRYLPFFVNYLLNLWHNSP